MPTDTGQATYLDAVGIALESEMDADPDVFIIGEDVGQFGGAFKVTKGFLEKYGPRRVVDTPIAEPASPVSRPVRLSSGCGPSWSSSSPTSSPAPSTRSSTSWPSTTTAPATPCRSRCERRSARGCARPMPLAERSKSLLRARPRHQDRHARTPEDAAGLLISSIRDNSPVLYLENKYLYRRLKAKGKLSLDPIPLGKANVVRQGTDVTLVTYSAGVSQGLEIAEELAKDGISIEVVDLRTLVPLDVETIVNSVKKTSRAVVLHEAALRMGYGAEVAATIQEQAFWYLDQPVRRIGALNTPTRRARPSRTRWFPSRRRSPQCCGRWHGHERLRHRRARRRSGRLCVGPVRRLGRALRRSGRGEQGRRHLPAPRCIPAKALLQAAEVYRTVGHAGDFGSNCLRAPSPPPTGRRSTRGSRASSVSCTRG